MTQTVAPKLILMPYLYLEVLIAELTFNLSLHRRVPGPLPCLHTALTHP